MRCNHGELKGLRPGPQDPRDREVGRFTLTPLLGSAVQPSSTWEALESRRMTRERGEQRCQKARRSGEWTFGEVTVNLLTEGWRI